MIADIELEDRGEIVSLMEPLLISQGSRHRGGDYRPRIRSHTENRWFSSESAPKFVGLARRFGAGHELLLFQPH